MRLSREFGGNWGGRSALFAKCREIAGTAILFALAARPRLRLAAQEVRPQLRLQPEVTLSSLAGKLFLPCPLRYRHVGRCGGFPTVVFLVDAHAKVIRQIRTGRKLSGKNFCDLGKCACADGKPMAIASPLHRLIARCIAGANAAVAQW